MVCNNLFYIRSNFFLSWIHLMICVSRILKFLGWSVKHFPKPRIFKKYKVSYYYGYFYKFRQIYGSEECKFC